MADRSPLHVVVESSRYLGVVVQRLAGERGEGVISTAIAVLVMAFLGAAMWAAFRDVFATAADSTRSKVEEIGR